MKKFQQDSSSAELRRILAKNEEIRLPFGLPLEVEKIRRRHPPSKLNRAYLLSRSLREWGVDPMAVLWKFEELPAQRRDALNEVLPGIVEELDSLVSPCQFIRRYNLDIYIGTPETLELKHGRKSELVVNTVGTHDFQQSLHSYSNIEDVVNLMEFLQWVSFKKYSDDDSVYLGLFDKAKIMWIQGKLGPRTVDALASLPGLRDLHVDVRGVFSPQGSREVLGVKKLRCDGELSDGFDWAILPNLEHLALYSGQKRELPTKNFPTGLKSLFFRNYRFDWNGLFGEVLGLRKRGSKQALLERAIFADNLEPLTIPAGFHTSLSDLTIGGCKIEGLANLAGSKNLTRMQIDGGKYDEEDLAALLNANRKLLICLRKKSARMKARFPDIADRVFDFPYWNFKNGTPRDGTKGR